MAFIQRLGSLRSPVSTYANLPITGNVIGDLRISTDVGVLYTWTSESSSGSLTDWKKVTVSSYNDLVNRPSSSQLAIDNCITAIRNICLNHLLIFFKKTISYGIIIQKMYDGFLDNFSSLVTLDETKSENYRWIKAQGINTYDYFYTPTFNTNLDSYTKCLVHGGNYNDGGFDALRNQIMNIWATDSISHFNSKVIVPSPYAGFGSPTVVTLNDSDFSLNTDMTWDMWVYQSGLATGQKLLEASNVNGGSDSSFSLIVLDNGKIYGRFLTSEGSIFNEETNEFDPVNPIDLEVTSISTLSSLTWNHIAIQRQNGYLKLYINGILEATSTLQSNNSLFGDGQGRLTLGRFFNGYLDEVRYSYNIARYSSNFTPMTEAYDTPSESAPCNNMIIQSSGFEANAIPTSARIVIFQDYTNVDPQEVLPNIDLKAYVSRDGGTTFTEVTLVREMDIPIEGYTSFLGSSANWYVGTIDLSTQPSGKLLVWKITTHNNIRSWIRSIALNWK